MPTARFTTISDIKNSLGLVTREFSYRSSSISLFIPSALRYGQIPPRQELVCRIADYLEGDGKTVCLCCDANELSEWLDKLLSMRDFKVVDLAKDRFRKTDGIGDTQTERSGKHDNLRIPILKELYAYSTFFEDTEIVPIVTPHPSAVFLVGGVLGSFISIVPTETRTRILLEANTGAHADATVEVFSLFFNKIPYSIYDFSGTFKWSGRGYRKEINDKMVLISMDPVSGDALVSKIFGWPVLASRVVRCAHDLQIGEAIEIESDPDIPKSDTFKMRRMINDRNALFFPFNYLARFSVAVTSECDKCLECMYVCPNGSISVDDGSISINHMLCVRCFACVDACHKFALEIKRKP